MIGEGLIRLGNNWGAVTRQRARDSSKLRECRVGESERDHREMREGRTSSHQSRLSYTFSSSLSLFSLLSQLLLEEGNEGLFITGHRRDKVSPIMTNLR